MVQRISIPTKHGSFTATFSEKGLARLEFPERSPKTVKPSTTTPGSSDRPWAELTKIAVHAVLAGKPLGILPPLDLDSGTEFQVKVWNAMTKIPMGKTQSYSEIAARVRRAKAARAVGNACGANPIPLLVPCHRVLAAGGKLGGFGGGLDWKKRLLSAEGHTAFGER